MRASRAAIGSIGARDGATLVLHAVDIAAGRVVRTYDLGSGPEETVYAIRDLT